MYRALPISLCAILISIAGPTYAADHREVIATAATAMGEYNGQEVPVMHACGHDNPVAILMGVATVLAKPRPASRHRQAHLPTRKRIVKTAESVAAGDENKVIEVKPITGAEDFSFFQKEIPGFYFFLGVNKEGVGPYEAASNHSPYFYANEDALIVGVRALAGLAWDYLSAHAPQ